MLLTFSAIVAIVAPLSNAKPVVPYTFHNGTTPTYEVDFWSGIACSGIHTGDIRGPPKNHTGSLDDYKVCEAIPYHGVTGAATFRGHGGYVFRLHSDSLCLDEEVGVGGTSVRCRTFESRVLTSSRARSSE